MGIMEREELSKRLRFELPRVAEDGAEGTGTSKLQHCGREAACSLVVYINYFTFARFDGTWQAMPTCSRSAP